MSYPFRSCHRCGKDFFSSYEEHICQDCLKDLGWEPTPYSNAQHIRSMTDEELAEFWTAPFCDRRTTRECKVVFGGDCSACVLDWLKQPYKEATDD